MHLASQIVVRIRQDTPRTQGYKTPLKASCRGGKVWGDVGFVVLRGVALHCLALIGILALSAVALFYERCGIRGGDLRA